MLKKVEIDPEKLRRLLARQIEEQEQAPAQPEASATQGEGTQTTESEALHFDLKPEELEAYLDQYVIKQQEAKAILATKICTHFNRLKTALRKKTRASSATSKNNVLMVGPTGVGKNLSNPPHCPQKSASLLSRADATKFSETGYVGGDVEDLVRDLVREANGDIERAQCGIIYIDEIDKNRLRAGSTRPGCLALGRPAQSAQADGGKPTLTSRLRTTLPRRWNPSSRCSRPAKLNARRSTRATSSLSLAGPFPGSTKSSAAGSTKAPWGSAPKPTRPTSRPISFCPHVRAEDLIEYGFESEFHRPLARHRRTARPRLRRSARNPPQSQKQRHPVQKARLSRL